jgi:hypothetical protein
VFASKSVGSGGMWSQFQLGCLPASHKIDMVWLNSSPMPVGMRAILCLFKLFLPACALPRARRGGSQHPVEGGNRFPPPTPSPWLVKG